MYNEADQYADDLRGTLASLNVPESRFGGTCTLLTRSSHALLPAWSGTGHGAQACMRPFENIAAPSPNPVDGRYYGRGTLRTAFVNVEGSFQTLIQTESGLISNHVFYNDDGSIDPRRRACVGLRGQRMVRGRVSARARSGTMLRVEMPPIPTMSTSKWADQRHARVGPQQRGVRKRAGTVLPELVH